MQQKQCSTQAPDVLLYSFAKGNNSWNTFVLRHAPMLNSRKQHAHTELWSVTSTAKGCMGGAGRGEWRLRMSTSSMEFHMHVRALACARVYTHTLTHLHAQSKMCGVGKKERAGRRVEWMIRRMWNEIANADS